jgi:DNA-binding PadR family transcriptional regulator
VYEFLILSQLMHGPAHGYLIAKIINDTIGPYARISYGRMYPLLAKMEQEGLIEVDSDGQSGPVGHQKDNKQRIYRLTDEGRLRFHFLMNDTSSNPGDYPRLFAHKATAFSFISPYERVRLIDHYITYCQAHMYHMQAESIDLVRRFAEMQETQQSAHGIPMLDEESLGYTVKVMQHYIDHWEHEIAWAKELRAEEAARVEQPQGSVTETIDTMKSNHHQ